MSQSWTHAQQEICRKYSQPYVAAEPDSKLGFTISTEGKRPVNGLRHPPAEGTNGWYIWCGDQLSAAPDFFSPLHTEHLAERCPQALKYLALPPGYRFLVAGDYEDVWFDASLLEI